MAKSVRIDKVMTLPDGQVTVEFTAGWGPLPSAAGQQAVYPSMPALFEAIQSYEDSVSDEALMFLALAQWLKADPQMKTAALAKDKLASMDLTGATAVVRVA